MADEPKETSEDTTEEETTEPTVATSQEGTSEVTLEQLQEKVSTLEEANKNLTSQRDTNFSKNESLEGRLDVLEAEKERDSYIEKFLKENKKEYSYVDVEDLLAGTSPSDIEAIAKRVQAKAEKIEQKAMAKIQEVKAPKPLTGEAKAAKLESLKKRAQEGDTKAFEEMLELESIV